MNPFLSFFPQVTERGQGIKIDRTLTAQEQYVMRDQ